MQQEIQSNWIFQQIYYVSKSDAPKDLWDAAKYISVFQTSL